MTNITYKIQYSMYKQNVLTNPLISNHVRRIANIIFDSRSMTFISEVRELRYLNYEKYTK